MRCYSHLSDDERDQIGIGKALGHSIGAIARAIGRPKSTVWHELSPNRLPRGRYSPLHAAGAHQLAGGVKRGRKRSNLTDLRCRPARRRVAPRANAGWLKGGNEPGLRAVGGETIYAFIYWAAQQAEQLWRYLTRRHKRRRSRPSPIQLCRQCYNRNDA
jgi:IS30 family transposase